jgi:hypothetical protein
MIKISINGGLGNQMFQYALGRAVSLKNKMNLTLDISWYNDYGKNIKRGFELNKFNIDAKIHKPLFPFSKKILIKIGLIKIIKEKEIYEFDKEILKIKDGYLSGYWQNENYFKNISHTLKKDFSLKDKPTDKFLFIKEIIINSDSIAIHIRRGDYVTNNETNNFHGICNIDYYNRAIKMIKEKINNPHFFIFSDDINWAKNNLIVNKNIEWVSDYKLDDVEDLILMSLCKHQVIANSSFSWWGAYLNSNPSKIVIAPKKWLNNEDYDTSRIIPDSWIKI